SESSSIPWCSHLACRQEGRPARSILHRAVPFRELPHIGCKMPSRPDVIPCQNNSTSSQGYTPPFGDIVGGTTTRTWSIRGAVAQPNGRGAACRIDQLQAIVPLTQRR